jgi:hypothetical protein
MNSKLIYGMLNADVLKYATVLSPVSCIRFSIRNIKVL